LGGLVIGFRGDERERERERKEYRYGGYVGLLVCWFVGLLVCWAWDAI
jgi:hypothetical protein